MYYFGPLFKRCIFLEKGRDTMSDEEKLVSHYRLKTLLRRDGFGAVYLAEDTRDQKETILRVIDLDQKTLAAITGRVRARSQRDHPLIEQIRQRMKRISELKHSHILSVNEFGEEHIQGNNDIIFYMASPLEKASLLSYWSEHTSSTELISLEIVADLLVQAAGALLLVHKRGLVHQYVRLSSFMLRSSTRGRKHLHLLLTDFWFADISAAILEDGQMAQALSVHLAPEQLSGGIIAAASDQYALAVLAYELLLGHRLSGVNLSLKLYETFVRQHVTEISESELIIACNIDLVLGRALSENPAARFQNIEEFALTFLAASRGETIDLVSDATIKLPSQRKQTATIVEVAAGALLAGELIEDLTTTQETATILSDSTAGLLAAAQIDEEKTHLQHGHSLHKTILTSEGMEAVALEQNATDVTLASEASTTTPVAGAIAGAAGFVAGLAVGEVLGETAFFEQQTQIADASTVQSGDIANEQTQTAGASTVQSNDIANEQTLIAGASTVQSNDIANEQTLIAGASTVQSNDIANEQTQIAGASTAQSSAIANEQTQVMPSSAATSTASDIADENTLILGSGALAAGAVAAALLASEANTGAIIQSGAAASATTNMADESTRILTHADRETPLLASEANTGATLQPGAPTLRASEADTNDITQPSATGTLPTSGPALEETQFATSAAALAGAALAAGGTQQAGLAGATLATGGTQQAGLAGATLAASGTQQAGGGMIGAAGSGFAATSGGMARRRRRPLLVASLIVLALVLVGGTIFAAFAVFGTVNQSSATVTLTLQSHAIQTSYLVTAITSTTSTTNTSQGQVQARTLSSTISQSKSGQASGFFPGVQASGFITFRNTSTGCGCPVIIPAGTTLTSANGVRVVTETIASVASLCAVTVRAHAANFGPSGDISVGAVNTMLSPTMSATNPFAFGGGQAGQSNSLVQQSDIDGLSGTLQIQVMQSAQAGISSQLQSNEHLLNTPACQVQTSSDHPAGVVATTINVTVNTTCTAEVYDYAGAAQWTQQQVQTQAVTYGSQFSLVGDLHMQVKSATLVDAQTGKILLEIGVTGTWSYQLSNSQKKEIAAFIPGKNVNQVRTFLANFVGVEAVSIAISGNDRSKLPTDVSKIKIVTK